MKKIITCLIVLFISSAAIAQLAVTNSAPYNTPTYLVNNVLLGTGISTTNITFSGDTNQIGYFSNGLAGAVNPLGLNNGIVFSSGNVNDIPTGGSLSTNFNTPGDPDLLTIAQSIRPAITSTIDAATLEFDFVPDGDTVEFRFVFASDEYKAYINTDFNDIFAFFLSGPGFSGPYAAPAGFPNGAENLAVVPGTSTPISISTIYNYPILTPPSLNGQYYIDNPTENTFGFNGYTTVMSVKFFVTCNALYHFKFSIADCLDGFVDTGVFMEGSSFSSYNPGAINFSTTLTGGDSTVIEGCENAKLNFTRSDTAGDLTLHYTIGGIAINGVDYSLIADSVTYLSGIDTASITITPYTDGLMEGQESITITTTSINACGNTTTSSDILYINDNTIVTLTAFNPNTLCNNNSVLPLPTGTPTGGNYSGSGVIGGSFHPASAGIGTHQIIYSYTDSNFCTNSDSTTVTVTSLTIPIASPITTSDTIICIDGTVTLSATATGSTPPISLIWDNGLLGNGPHNVSPIADSTIYNVYAQDANGCVSDTQSIVVSFFPPILIDTIYLTDTIVCDANPTTIVVNATGGGTGLIYTWLDGNNSVIGATAVDTFVITPNYDGEIFSVIVSDSCTTPIYIDSASVNIETCTGINEASNDFGLMIYPNPSNGKFIVEKPEGVNKPVQIKLLDATSKLILEQTIPADLQNAVIDITNYSNGIYYLQIIVKDQVYIKQILKN